MSEDSSDCMETYWLDKKMGLAMQIRNSRSILAAVIYRYDVGWS